jgi:hypothetical protein
MAYQQPAAPVYQQTVPVQAVVPVAATSTILGLDVQDTTFWKGALLGAAVAMLVTNETVQKCVVKSVSKLTAAAQSGVEEMKEKFEDAKAEALAETDK